MKKLFIVLLVSVSAIKAYSQSSEIGTIYSSGSWTTTSDFVTNGNTSLTVSGNFVNVTSSTQLNYSNTIYISNYLTKLSRWKFRARFKILSFTSNSYGIGFGLKSANINVQNDVFGFIQTSNTGAGGLYILKSDMTVLKTGPLLGVALNDLVDIEVALTDSVLTMSAVNVTSGSSAVTSYTYVWDGSPKVIPNTSYFAIYELGGVHQLQSIDISSTEKTGAQLVVIGDSKTAGYFANSFAGRYAAQLNNIYPVTVINAGGADRVTHAMARTPELIRLAPVKYLLCIGSNDIRFGTSLSALQANYSTLVNSLQATGAQVYHILMPEDITKPLAIDQTAFRNWLASTYGSNYINGVWDSLASGNVLKGIYDYSDGVHLNQSGNNKVYEALVASGKLMPAVSLPAKFLDFSVKRTGAGSIQVCWSIEPTASTSKIILHKSGDGIVFKALKEFSPGLADHCFTDAEVLPGNNYYRISILEASGAIHKSGTLRINNIESFVMVQGIKRNELRLLAYTSMASPMRIDLIDRMGRIVKSTIYNLVKGTNTVLISIAEIPHGVYYVNANSYGQCARMIITR
jgi:lysophospholipase L1-like esterase